MTQSNDERFLALKAVMMPRDTNPHGTIFGGVILSHIDQAGAVGARYEICRAGWQEKPIVTVAMDKVEFHMPVFVGDTVSFYTRLVKMGTTSITMHVTVETYHDTDPTKVTEAIVTYVAIDSASHSRKPVPIRD